MSLETTFFRLPMGMLWFTRWLNFVHELLIVAVLFWSSRIMYTESIMLWLHHLTRKLLLRDAILFQRDVSLIILPFPRCFCDSKTESKCLDLSLVFESRSTVYEVLLQRFCRKTSININYQHHDQESVSPSASTKSQKLLASPGAQRACAWAAGCNGMSRYKPQSSWSCRNQNVRT